MKTAISIPDSIFQAAEKAAASLSISRSELYAKAVEQYVKSLELANVKDRLNVVYAEHASSLDPALIEMQCRSIDVEKW